MTRAVDDIDSDSGRTPLDDDKSIGATARELETIGRNQLPPDPDAGLSEEEKARIVCVGIKSMTIIFLSHFTRAMLIRCTNV